MVALTMRSVLLVLAMLSSVSTFADSPRAALPSVNLPPELDRVLRDYERAWQAQDADGLAALFAADGYVLSDTRPPVRGRAAIREAYAHAGGPLWLRALAYAQNGAVGWIVGGYRHRSSGPDDGKFVLALRRGNNGLSNPPWEIAADIDNSNQRR
jgi:hypothetical protein